MVFGHECVPHFAYTWWRWQRIKLGKLPFISIHGMLSNTWLLTSHRLLTYSLVPDDWAPNFSLIVSCCFTCFILIFLYQIPLVSSFHHIYTVAHQIPCSQLATIYQIRRVYFFRSFFVSFSDFCLFFSLGQFCMLFAAFWSQNLWFACYFLHFGTKISDLHAICCILDLKSLIGFWLLAFGRVLVL